MKDHRQYYFGWGTSPTNHHKDGFVKINRNNGTITRLQGLESSVNDVMSSISHQLRRRTMRRLIPCVMTGLMVVFLTQNLLAQEPAGPPGPPNVQPTGPNPEILFNRLDANHDGVITQDELPPGMPEMFKQLLFLADSNGDGKIALDELTTAIKQHRPGTDRDIKAGSQIRMLSLHNSNAAETAKIIDQVYGNQKDQKMSITVDTRLNSLIVSAPKTLSDEIQALVQRLDTKTPDSNSPPTGPRFRGPEGQADQMPGPPFGRRFGGPEGRPGEMAGPPFGRRGQGPRVEPSQKPADADAPEGSVRVEVYSVGTNDPQFALKVLQTLLAGLPDVRMDVIPKTNNLIVLARPAQHAAIRATLEKMQPDTKQVEATPVRMPVPPINGPEGRPDRMPGPPLAGPGGQRGWMGGQGFGGPGMGQGWMGGQGFGRGGPDGRHPQMAGPNFHGPVAGAHRMGGSPFSGPEGRPWAGPGYGPPHRWAAFETMQQGPPQHPWQQYKHFGLPNRHWQANSQRPNHPWMAYGARPQRHWQQYGHFGPPNRHWQANYERPRRLQFSLKTLFDRIDTNHDNQLSFEEFSQGMKHLMQAILPRPGPQWARPVGMFGSQNIAPPAYHPLANYPPPQSEIIREKIAWIFQTFDKNHDGKLTKDEAPPIVQKNFDRIDVDKKGFVTPRDIHRTLLQLRQRKEVQNPLNQGVEKTPEINAEKTQAKGKSE
jgi:Ca2+-binding EF-hand superfamily protein